AAGASVMKSRIAQPNPSEIRRCYLRALMLDAWNEARGGAARYGGSAADYIPLSMVFAWADTTANPAARVTASLMADFRSCPQRPFF
ncbi:MAG: hypothetical protein AB7F89_14770, partial [Pirellulaceae bacterium]